MVQVFGSPTFSLSPSLSLSLYIYMYAPQYIYMYICMQSDLYQDAMRLKGLAMRGFVDYSRDALLANTKVLDQQTIVIFVNHSISMQPENTVGEHMPA